MTLALNAVLTMRNRTDDEGKIAKHLSELGLTTVGHLRLLSDSQWRGLTEKLPTLCVLYLRDLVRAAEREEGVAVSFGGQSSTVLPGMEQKKGSPFMRQLELDFNGGKPLHMGVFKANVERLTSMGITEQIALEALCITNNSSLENAVELCFADPITRSQRRKKAVAALRGKPLAALSGSGGEAKSPSEASGSHGASAGGSPSGTFSSYQGYLRGLTASDRINLSEMAKLKQLREELKIDDELHVKALLSIGLTEKEFDGMKNTAQQSDRECVVCLDNPKEVVVQDCNHLCLCETCHEMYKSERDPRCPMCSKPIKSFLRVYS